MAKPTQTFRETVSFLPEDMISGGLPDDFNGRMDKVRIVPFNYLGNRAEYSLAVRVDITPDEDSGLDPFSQYYTAGNLAEFVPTIDGKTPVGATVDQYLELAAGEGVIPDDEIGEYEGTEFLPIGKKTGVANNSNFALFLAALLTLPEGPKIREIWSKQVSFLEGMVCHFNRLEPDTKTKKSRSGLQEGAGAGDSNKERKGDGKILLPTELIEMPPSANGKKKTAASTAAPAKASSKPTAAARPVSKPTRSTQLEEEPDEPEEQEEGTETETEVEDQEGTEDSDTDNGERDFDSEVSAAVLEILATKNGKVARSALLPLIMGHFEGKDKPAAMQRAGQDDFLTGFSDLWKYDAKSKTLTLA